MTDDTLPEMALFVGGKFFQMLFVSAAFAATVASALASHASVSRLLHVMGRNGVLRPSRLFAYIHPTRRTPVYAIILVGVVSLLATSMSLELVSSMINFGALVAFSFVNFSVIAHFVFKRREFRSAKQVAQNIVLPVVGAGMTGILWSFLHKDALIAGLTWASIGVVYAFILTRTTGRKLSELSMSDAATEPAVEEVREPELALR